MFVSIPAECLQEIFEHLQDDELSLHSILLVNRFWCKNVLPILWRQPFYLCAKKGASPKLVETYIQCMDNESKCRLKRECKPLKRKISSRVQPHFNYTGYLRRIATNDLWESVRKWVNNKDHKVAFTSSNSSNKTKENTNTKTYSSSNKQSSSSAYYDHLMSPDQRMIICVVKELSLLINKQCSAFDQLIFNTDHDEVIGFYLLRCLPQIREFNYSGWGNKERNLDVASRSNNCQNLKKLIIEKVSTESKRGVYGLKYGGIGRLEPITTFFPIPRSQRHNDGFRGNVTHENAIFNDLILSSPYVRHHTYNIIENIDIGTTNLLDPFYEIFTSAYTTETSIPKNLSSSCNDLPRSERENLENLIKSQKKLRHISISFCDLNMNFINSLESQSRSLTYLEFDTITFESNVDMESFGIFVNLKTLILTNCSWDNNIINSKQHSNNIRSYYHDNLSLFQSSSTTSTNNYQSGLKQCIPSNDRFEDPFSTFPLFLSLQTLSVRASSFSQDSLLFLIKSSSHTLHSLTLNCQHDIDIILLTFIITHCNQIRELEFYIKVHDLIDCFRILSECHTLRKLKLCNGTWGINPSKQLLKITALIPKGLRVLIFPKIWTFSSVALDEFLKKCDVKLKVLELVYSYYG